MNNKILEELNFSEIDYKEICKLLDREPTIVELGIFSAMWSEHCSYRSSKESLKKFPTRGKNVIHGPGENAGVINIDDNQYLVFKVESHNHPSAVEPFQGAATGVGGIIRDIFTMGARPIATLDSLCFDYPYNERAKYLLNGVVEGISHYGNCVGVPTIGGETHFDQCYSENPLVNVMCVGILDKANLRTSVAKTNNAKLIYIGAKTGRDGLHGASFASGLLDEKAQQRRGSIQIGDPFLEKLLIEATLEIIEEDLIEAIQDMGAAGLTSSSVEMAGKNNMGVKLDLNKVPLRGEGLTPFEIMLSESQERMLLVSKMGKEDRIKEVLDKWELDYAIIGEITETGNIELLFDNEKVCDVPIAYLLNPPLNQTIPVINETEIDIKSDQANSSKDIISIIDNPSFGSKNWIFEQYDNTLFSNTIIHPGNDATLLRLKNTDFFIGLTLNSNGKLCKKDPYLGAKTLVAVSARRISALGVAPTAVTDCLNFANPLESSVMWEFSNVIDGLSEALKAFEIPVVSGNVSFYNEGKTTKIFPTPTIGMVGIGKLNKIISNKFVNSRDIIVVIGDTNKEFYNSKTLPALDLELEIKIQSLIRDLINNDLVESVQSIDRDGILLKLIRSVCESNIGAEIDSIPDKIDLLSYITSESNSRYLITIKKEKLEKVIKEIGDINFDIIGNTMSDKLIIKDLLNEDVVNIKNIYERSFSKYLKI